MRTYFYAPSTSFIASPLVAAPKATAPKAAAPPLWRLPSNLSLHLLTMSTHPVTLHFPENKLPWVIRSDASDHAVGAALFQIYTEFTGTTHHQPIAFTSHKRSGRDTIKQGAYALYHAVIQFNSYLCGKSFDIEIDHRNLVWMESSQVPIVDRYWVFLLSFIFEVYHVLGKDNWLSRMYPPAIG